MAIPPGPKAPVYDAGGGQPQPALGAFLLDANGNVVPAVAPGPTNYLAITPADATLLTGYQWLRVGAAGNVAIAPTVGGTAIIIPAVAGEYIPFGSGVIKSTGTTATGILGFLT